MEVKEMNCQRRKNVSADLELSRKRQRERRGGKEKKME